MSNQNTGKKEDYALIVVDPSATKFVLIHDLEVTDPYRLLTFEQVEEGNTHVKEVDRKYPYVRGNDPSIRRSENVPYKSISAGVLFVCLAIPVVFLLALVFNVSASVLFQMVLNLFW